MGHDLGVGGGQGAEDELRDAGRDEDVDERQHTGGIADGHDGAGVKIRPEALTESIDDQRDWVRTWAIEAVEEQLDRENALAQFRAVLPGVHRPDARSAVSEAITRLERRPAG